MTYLLVVLYLVAIVAANLSATRFGPSATIVNAFAFIGLDLTTRDRLHDFWTRRRLPKMAALIAAGSALSYALNRDAATIATASAVAFAAAEAVDYLVYFMARRQPWLERSTYSNVASAAVDSLVFPTLAFGGFIWEVSFAQFCAKVAGGVLWAFLIGRIRRRTAPA